MALFETTLVLLFVAVLLLQVSRRLGTPYPSMLALAGAGVALLPWAPQLHIDPHLAMALFVAPALLDAAYDTAPRELRRNWIPLVSLVLVAVMLTTAAVALAGWSLGGLPLGAAIALGAIVAPPDAAAASAVLGQFQLPRRALTVLQGEGLLNDAVALLIFGAAVSATTVEGGFTPLSLVLAVPGGLALGWLWGTVYARLAPFLAGTMSSTVAQFTGTFGLWVIAERLRLSPILAVVTHAMILARILPSRLHARERVHSYSVWAAVVFVLNVLAFLLMGLQARGILGRLGPGELGRELAFAGVVLAIVILVRLAWVMIYGVAVRRLRPKGQPLPRPRVGLLVSWCGMRGVVTLATAFALPSDFPGRDRIVLSAFVVVIGTLVVQGLTLRPLIAWLDIKPDPSLEKEISVARSAMLDAALEALKHHKGDHADAVRAEFRKARELANDRSRPQGDTPHDLMRLEGIATQRKVLENLRSTGRIDDDAYHRLEEEMDWAELSASPREQLQLAET